MAVQEAVQNAPERTEYVNFWNDVLVPKFVRWKHILVDGLTLHSEAIFPTLQVKPGGRVVDVGCGFGDTAIKLAQIVGPSGSVLAIDCCDGFLEYGRRDAKALRLSARRHRRPPRSGDTAGRTPGPGFPGVRFSLAA